MLGNIENWQPSSGSRQDFRHFTNSETLGEFRYPRILANPTTFENCERQQSARRALILDIILLTTQKSLIFRIRDTSDALAWSQFVEIYGPLVYRYGRSRGLQDADAADLSQTVLTEVAQCIDRFNYDTRLGRFRNWLIVIARYKLSHFRKKETRLRGSGDTKAMTLLEEQTSHDELSEKWEAEYRDHLFRWASEQVRNEVEDQTWRAFWRTTVDQQAPSKVARELGMKVGTVYVAKSRVLLRMREKVAEVDEDA